MIYDFETLVSRKNTGSGKWDEMTKEHPNLPENVAPLSVADMEWSLNSSSGQGVASACISAAWSDTIWR